MLAEVLNLKLLLDMTSNEERILSFCLKERRKDVPVKTIQGVKRKLYN